MQIIDNINHIVKNDLQESIRTGSKLSIAAACFSIYAYQLLTSAVSAATTLIIRYRKPKAMRMPIIFSNFLNNFGMIKIDYKKLQTL